MAMDRVRVLKIEKPSTGGTQTDIYPTDINPNEDAVDARGVAIQNDSSADESVLISRDASSNMTFADGQVSGTKTLNDLLAAGGDDDDQVKDNVPVGETFTVKEEYQHITYDEFTVAGEYIVNGEAVVLGGYVEGGGSMVAHALGGSYHTASTLAQLNARVSDATLDTSSASRTPTSHASSHENGNADEISVAGLSGELADNQPALAHALGGSKHTSATLAQLNALVSDATLDTSSATRTPASHSASHQPGGGDAMVVDASAATGSLRTIGTGALTACAGNDARLSNSRTPTAHASTHQPGGADAMAVDAAAVTGSLRTIGTGALTACAGNDSRLSNARTPTAHASTHVSGGSDSIKLDDFAVPDDNTDLNSTTARHGLLPKLGGGTSNFLRADGTWAATPAGGTTIVFSGYNNAGGGTVNGTWLDVPIDTETKKTTGFTHSTTSSPANITIGATGTYKIDVQVSTIATSGTSRSETRIRILVDSGSGFVEIDGTRAVIYNRNSDQGAGTAAVSIVKDLTANNVLKVQVIRASGLNTIQLLADGSRVVIVKL